MDGERRSSPYLSWAEGYATGAAAAADKTMRHRVAQGTRGVEARAARADLRCTIKGCDRRPHKGELCKKHWDMVPAQDKIDLMLECMKAQRAAAAKAHRRMRRELQSRLNDQGAPH